MTGWTCPKCGYSWSLAVMGCGNCNRPDHEKTIWTTATAALSPQPKPKPAAEPDAKGANNE